MDMRIGIDISQIVYEGTGVAAYVRRIVQALIDADHTNTYVLFGASFKRRDVFDAFYAGLPHDRVQLVTVPISPSVLDFMWNRMHIEPVEKFIGPVDIFWSSDWTQPPLRHAAGMTTIHDLTPLLFPKETDGTIAAVHKRRLKWVKKECKLVLCDSEATKRDVVKHLGIPEARLRVIYPGI